jgi:hypothetical protein
MCLFYSFRGTKESYADACGLMDESWILEK